MEDTDKAKTTVTGDSPKGERHPLTPEHLFVITELAKLGMAYLKLALPEFAKEQDGAGRQKLQHYEHLKSLYEVAGPETVRHFDEMCQYLYARSRLRESQEEAATPPSGAAAAMPPTSTDQPPAP